MFGRVFCFGTGLFIGTFFHNDIKDYCGEKSVEFVNIQIVKLKKEWKELKKSAEKDKNE